MYMNGRRNQGFSNSDLFFSLVHPLPIVIILCHCVYINYAGSVSSLDLVIESIDNKEQSKYALCMCIVSVCVCVCMCVKGRMSGICELALNTETTWTSICDQIWENPPYGINAQFAQCVFLVH